MKSKSELNKQAQELSIQYNAPVVYGTSDGQFFLEKNRADLHSKAKNLTVYEFPKDGTEADASEPVSNAGTLPSAEFRAKNEKELKKNKDKKAAPPMPPADQGEKGNEGENPQEDEAEAQKAKEAATEILKSDTDLNQLEYKSILQMVKDLRLITENNKQPTLLTALLAERENLKNQENG
jgi:hypothetical protein